jgi:5-methyltetrahydrofolate--homocysteine methyltransferase
MPFREFVNRGAQPMNHLILDLALRRPVVFDGAMGTEIQLRNLTATDFDGLDGLNEILVVTRPDVILDIHRAYYAAGADVVETDSFGSNAVILREYGQETRARELSRVSALLARRAADEFGTPARPRFVSGSVGPGTRLPTLGQISYDEMLACYRDQIAGLLEGGVDLVQIETCQDPLQAKIAVLAARDAMAEAGREVPLFVQVTFDRNGRMLLGTDPMAAVVTLANLPGVAAFGINCATGPEDMHHVLAELSRICPLPLTVLPNAGLPENIGGHLAYRLSPEDFARHVSGFVRDLGVSFVGGCCGTTPAHIAALVRALDGVVVGARAPVLPPSASSLFTAVPFAQEPRPLIMGERTNANGSKAFRDRLAADDVEGMVAIARDQQAEGAHLLDVCLALVGRDEPADARAYLPRLREVAEAPLVYDSTEADAMEVALQTWPGRVVLNSVNFEDGGARLDHVAAVARRHGAALVALTIDEIGMAMTTDRKVDIAKRLVDRLVTVHGFAPQDLFLDVLTFTLGSGDRALRDAGVRTLEAIRRVKAEIPGVFTSLGVSNVSFGLNPPARRVLNTVFLNHAVEAGLDAAILNAGRVVPLADIPAELRRLADDVVFDRSTGGDPLELFLQAFENAPAIAEDAGVIQALPAADRLHRCILRGDRTGLEAALDEERAVRAPMAIVTDILLEAMKVVGERFGRGEMQLPFVLRSAEAMKAAVRFLEPHMEKSDGAPKGTLVLATVAGDVHDIGKNLVDILLSNNGYRVVNLGIKQPVEAILDAAVLEHADAIGMSGLLVKSTVVMRDNLVEMQRRGLATPVLLGGAALTKRFVEEDLAARYSGGVTYCADAFDGLRVMEALAAGSHTSSVAREPSARPAAAPRVGVREVVSPVDAPPPVPFLGMRVEGPLPVLEVARYVNRMSLFRLQWQFKKGKRTDDEWQRLVDGQLEPMFQERLRRYAAEGILQPTGIRGFLPANADGDTVIVYDPDGVREVTRFAFPRQAEPPHLCLADFVLPVSSGVRDVLGFQVATCGAQASLREKTLFDAGEFSEYLYLHGLSVEIAEAAAEFLHRRTREDWGIAAEDAASPDEVLRKGYRGCRYSFGYPACPDLADQGPLLDLLGAARIGVTLTETLQMVPEQSTSAIVFHHPRARYFSA